MRAANPAPRSLPADLFRGSSRANRGAGVCRGLRPLRGTVLGRDPAIDLVVSRRTLIAWLTGGAAAWPILARAQGRPKPLVGVLNANVSSSNGFLVEALERGLKEGGFAAGRDYEMEYRWAEGHYDALPGLARSLVERHVSIIVAGGGTATVAAAKAATETIPVVFTSGFDAVAAGVVASLNRPGGNITGVMILTRELEEKRLQLLHELVPAARSIGVILNPSLPHVDLTAAARTLNVELHTVHVSVEGDLEPAFAQLAQEHVGGVLVGADPAFEGWRSHAMALAQQHRLPVIYRLREEAVFGGLAAYGPSLIEAYREAGLYAARILRGEKPSDLPVVQLRKLELVINLKTARAIDLAIPPTLLARADEVIE